MIKAVEWAIGGVVAVAIWIGMLLNLGSLDLDAFEKHLVLYVSRRLRHYGLAKTFATMCI